MNRGVAEIADLASIQVMVRYKEVDLARLELGSEEGWLSGEQCLDWLLLQSLGYRNSAAMTCGQLSGSDRVIISRGHQLLLHWHTANRLTTDQLVLDRPAVTSAE